MNGACILCNESLTPAGVMGLQIHPERASCRVRVTDALGVSMDNAYEVEDGQLYSLEEPPPERPGDFLAEFMTATPVDVACDRIFGRHGMPRLGGASSDLGWSSFATLQRCPYLWYRKYRVHPRDDSQLVSPGITALAVGSLFHTFVAVHYMNMFSKKYVLTPESMFAELGKEKVSVESLKESWRVFTAYRLYYRDEVVEPLAVEFKIVNPHTGHSCRYDAIVRLPETVNQRGGTWVRELKSSARFDDATLTGWVNDGEVIGQIALWKQLGLDRRFGELQGVCVDIAGKHKVPMFHRTYVSVNRWQVTQHAKDLARWHSLRLLFEATDSFPRSRANCVGRYGKCDEFDHCATGEN